MSISAAPVRELLLYTLWADRTMLSAVRAVSPEHLTRDAGVSFGSLLGTMVHMLGSQKVWLARFAGQTLDRRPTLEDLPDLLSWIHAWEEMAAGVEAFVAGLTDEHLDDPISWTSSQGEPRTAPLWQPVLHLVNHSTYHRGQMASLLRQLGFQPPATDLIDYFLR